MHGTFSIENLTQNETLPKKKTFLTWQILLNEHRFSSTENETFLSKNTFFDSKEIFLEYMELFNWKWNFSMQKYFFSTRKRFF